MATYKCDIKKQFGKFSGHVWKASDRPGEPICRDEPNSQAAVDRVLAGVTSAGFGDGDEIIFRDNAYGSLTELRGVLMRAPY